jgi:hypothetical protein
MRSASGRATSNPKSLSSRCHRHAVRNGRYLPIPAEDRSRGGSVPEALTPDQARDLLEIVEDRYDKGSLIITSQVPVDRWHDLIGIPTLADAILDRVIHNAYRIDLAGESLRKRRTSP